MYRFAAEIYDWVPFERSRHTVCYRKKRLATPDCFSPYLVNIASMESCSVCLETALTSEEFCMKKKKMLKLKKELLIHNSLTLFSFLRHVYL